MRSAYISLLVGTILLIAFGISIISFTTNYETLEFIFLFCAGNVFLIIGTLGLVQLILEEIKFIVGYPDTDKDEE